MNDDEYTKALTEILALHSKWADSDGKEGKQLDLSRRDLRGINLRYTNMDGAMAGWSSMRKAEMRWMDVRNSDLSEMRFNENITLVVEPKERGR